MEVCRLDVRPLLRDFALGEVVPADQILLQGRLVDGGIEVDGCHGDAVTVRQIVQPGFDNAGVGFQRFQFQLQGVQVVVESLDHAGILALQEVTGSFVGCVTTWARIVLPKAPPCHVPADAAEPADMFGDPQLEERRRSFRAFPEGCPVYQVEGSLMKTFFLVQVLSHFRAEKSVPELRGRVFCHFDSSNDDSGPFHEDVVWARSESAGGAAGDQASEVAFGPAVHVAVELFEEGEGTICFAVLMASDMLDRDFDWQFGDQAADCTN